MMDSEFKITTIEYGMSRDSEESLTAIHRHDDYVYGRDLLYKTSEQMQDLLDIAVMIAKESQHPRAVEVAKDTAAQLGDLATKLMRHQEQRMKMSGEKAAAPKLVTNNNLNVKMSSKELLELLRKD